MNFPLGLPIKMKPHGERGETFYNELPLANARLSVVYRVKEKLGFVFWNTHEDAFSAA